MATMPMRDGRPTLAYVVDAATNSALIEEGRRKALERARIKADRLYRRRQAMGAALPRFGLQPEMTAKPRFR